VAGLGRAARSWLQVRLGLLEVGEALGVEKLVRRQGVLGSGGMETRVPPRRRRFSPETERAVPDRRCVVGGANHHPLALVYNQR
jgi:hypothetical protein